MTSADRQAEYYVGIKMVHFDLVKELVLALFVVSIVVIGLAGALSSPDDPAVTIQTWATKDPVDFVTTAASELAGTSGTAGYGPPYNSTADAAQAVGPIAPQAWAGVSTPIDTAQDFVLRPLGFAAIGNPTLTTALQAYGAASATQQQSWLTDYSTALADATVVNDEVSVASGDYGPVPDLMTGLLGLARTGALDGLLLSNGNLFQTDFTRPLLFMGDGNYLPNLAADQHLTGDQWGMMNETGMYPGQTWLWLFSFWYQIPPFNTASNTDLVVIILMIVLTTLLALVPFIPILRDIPRWVPIHRLIWRRYYRTS
ncbi:MAG: hypothetical protein ABSE58_02690 [Candidatus Limnocylindrales bacterium]|jgi:hypothetical protein